MAVLLYEGVTRALDKRSTASVCRSMNRFAAACHYFRWFSMTVAVDTSVDPAWHQSSVVTEACCCFLELDSSSGDAPYYVVARDGRW